MRRTGRTVALLADYLICSYQVALVQAVEQATKSLGISLLTFAGRRLDDPKPDWATQSRIYELASPDTVDAVVILAGPVGMHVGVDKLPDFCRRFQPLPTCSVGFELPGIPSLIVSNRQGTRVAIEHLIVQHGATRIAYIRGPSDNEEAVERYQGYIDALTAHGLTLDEELIVDGEFNVATGAKATRELIARGVVFDSLAAANDYMALAAYDVLVEAEFAFPMTFSSWGSTMLRTRATPSRRSRQCASLSSGWGASPSIGSRRRSTERHYPPRWRSTSISSHACRAAAADLSRRADEPVGRGAPWSSSERASSSTDRR